MTDPHDIEFLAAAEHESWSRWAEHMLDKIKGEIETSLLGPEDRDLVLRVFEGLICVHRWRRQLSVHYSMLSEDEKKSDRQVVREKLPAYRQHVKAVFGAMRETAYTPSVPGLRRRELLDVATALASGAAASSGKPGMSACVKGAKELIAAVDSEISNLGSSDLKVAVAEELRHKEEHAARIAAGLCPDCFCLSHVSAATGALVRLHYSGCPSSTAL